MWLIVSFLYEVFIIIIITIIDDDEQIRVILSWKSLQRHFT